MEDAPVIPSTQEMPSAPKYEEGKTYVLQVPKHITKENLKEYLNMRQEIIYIQDDQQSEMY